MDDMKKELPINSNTGFLNLEDLPRNCIFNKKITGCGGTTVALFNGENYVITSPYTEVITNKTGLHEAGITDATRYDGKKQKVLGLFGEYSDGMEKMLKDYVKMPGTKKIICTYDKLPWVTSIIKPKEYRLLVDEYHILLRAFTYREKAISGVFSNFKKYKTFCFMSATPISPEFTPDVLDGIDTVEAEWKDTDRLHVKPQATNKPYLVAANYIREFKRNGKLVMDGKESHELFFFLNSVEAIKKILKYCKLPGEEVKIVCADNPNNRKRLRGYEISDSRAANRPFTFITSKSFEGADYFSDTGLCFVVSNVTDATTLLDISTDLPQIAGRIRTPENPFRNTIIHIYNTLNKRAQIREMSWDKLVEWNGKRLIRAKKHIDLMNDGEDETDFDKEIVKQDFFYANEDGTYSVNDMLLKLDLFTYKLEQVIYKDGIELRKAYSENDVEAEKSSYTHLDGAMKTASGKKVSFKEAFLKYAERMELAKKGKADPVPFDDPLVEEQPLIVEAYNELGPDKVRSLKYLKRNVKEALKLKSHDQSNEGRIAKMMASAFKPGFITCVEAKKKMAQIYSTMDIKRIAKASDLENWFKCKQVVRSIDNKSIRGYEIYMSRIVQKQ